MKKTQLTARKQDGTACTVVVALKCVWQDTDIHEACQHYQKERQSYDRYLLDEARLEADILCLTYAMG